VIFDVFWLEVSEVQVVR